MLGKRLEHVNTRNEEIVALILKAIRRTQRIEGSAHPFLASFGLLGHHAQFAIEEATRSETGSSPPVTAS